jgi:para-nitrobenzyl esterase
VATDLPQVAPGQLVQAATDLRIEMQANPDPGRFGEAASSAMLYQPVIDGETLPALPIERIAAGSAAGIDLLVGTTRDEAKLFTVAGGMTEFVTDAAVDGLAAMMGLPAEATARYRAARPDGAPWEILSDVMTDQIFRIPAIRLAEAHGRAWAYEYDWPVPALGGQMGACHAAEIGFVFDTLAAAEPMNGPDAPQALADAMHGAWVAFATSGDPGWERYGDARNVRRFATTVATEADLRGDTRELWTGVR